MTNEEIAAAYAKTVKAVDPLACPTCGARMDLELVGKVNPVYVARCPTVTVPHPTWICTPTFKLSDCD